MATNFIRANAAVNEEATRVIALLNSGILKIYAASQPATADTATSGQTLLATLTFNSTALSGSASGGVGTFAAITADTDAAATGTAAWFRCLKTDGTTPVFDGSIGTSGADINLSTTSIVQHATVSITSLVYTASKS